jgi:hypothetical protein
VYKAVAILLCFYGGSVIQIDCAGCTEEAMLGGTGSNTLLIHLGMVVPYGMVPYHSYSPRAHLYHTVPYFDPR